MGFSILCVAASLLVPFLGIYLQKVLESDDVTGYILPLDFFKLCVVVGRLVRSVLLLCGFFCDG